MNDFVPRWVDEALRCPRTHSPLQWRQREDGAMELVSVNESGPNYSYPVEGGVPILLASRSREVGQ